MKLAKEILVKNTAISHLIRENELHQIPSIMQTSSREGMQIIEHDLLQFINDGDITLEEGLKYANMPKFIKENVNS